MSLLRLPYTRFGQVISGLTLAGFLATTCGCGGISIGGDVDASEAYGVLINSDKSKDLIGGVRMRNGESAWVYGRFNDDGTIARVDATVFRNAQGQEATLRFGSGRPSVAVGFDGSRLDISYQEVSTVRLKGAATFTPANGTGPVTWAFDIDLQKTAAEIAQIVETLTGLQITTEPPPADGQADGSRANKSLSGRAELDIDILVLLAPATFAVTGFTIDLTLSQLLQSLDAAGEAVVLTFLMPFIIMGNLMRLALGMPLVTIDFDSSGAVLNIPRPWDE